MRRAMLWVAGVVGWLSSGLSGQGSRKVAEQRLVRQQSNQTATAIYIVAHQDDWQLFMGDEVAATLNAGIPATFIYLTAGDDGRDSTYWLTREKAALESARIASGGYSRGARTVSCDTARIAVHVIRRCTVGNTTSYFLRLPDGKRNGAGFSRHDYQSLRKLRQRTITALDAVDRSTRYSGWSDLAGTIDVLIRTASTNTKPVLHTTDPSITINPHDHFDHRVVGLLVEELRKQHSWPARYYVGYALASRAANRSAEETQEKTAAFRAYDEMMIRGNPGWSAYAEHPKFYAECMQRTYARSVPRARR